MSGAIEPSSTDAGDYPELRIDAQLCLALQICDSLVTRLYRPLLAPLGLTHSQYLVLLVLWEHGRATMSSLRRTLNLDTGSVTPLVKRLEANGLVTRSRDPADERRVWVDLTDSGRSMRGKVAEVRRDVGRRIPMTGPELSELRATLQRLNTELQAVLS